jgi:hypothetical protein
MPMGSSLFGSSREVLDVDEVDDLGRRHNGAP